MMDFWEHLLAAPRKGREFSWIAPLVIFGIYALSAIAKAITNAKEKRERETEPVAVDKPRYKALDRGGTAIQPVEKPRYKPLDQRQSAPPQARKLPYGTYSEQPAAGQEGHRPVRSEPVEVSHPTAQQVPTRPQPQPTMAIEIPPQRTTVSPAQQRALAAQRQRAQRKQVAAKKLSPAEVKTYAGKEKPIAKKAGPVEHEQASLTIFARLAKKSEMQRAILFSEILGKPVGMRDL